MKKLLTIAPAALQALQSWQAGKPAPAPSFSLCTSSGLAAACDTFTGAFRALRFLPSGERETARIFDDDGYCLYR